MKLKLFESEHTRKLYPEDLRDYRTFSEHYPLGNEAKEIQVFERFYAARFLLEKGLQAYMDPIIGDAEGTSGITVDTCGVRGESLTLVLCETGRTNPSLTLILNMVSVSQNARAVILAPMTLNTKVFEDLLPSAFQNGKIAVETMGWFDDHLDRTLRETLSLIGLLGNETRMRMLTPLFRKTSGKREYRTTINPKLVYKNLSVLLEARLVNEHEGGYELSVLGKDILAEFITFLEKTRRALDLDSKDEEVRIE